MKWLICVLLFIQAEGISSCIFDKVEIFSGTYFLSFEGNENQCFAACHGNMDCTALQYEKAGTCFLYGVGDQQYECTTNDSVCYILQRDEVASVCERFVHF